MTRVDKIGCRESYGVPPPGLACLFGRIVAPARRGGSVLLASERAMQSAQWFGVQMSNVPISIYVLLIVAAIAIPALVMRRWKILIGLATAVGALILFVFGFSVVMGFAEVNAKHGACEKDWHECKTNEELADFWDGYGDSRAACRAEAFKRAKFGDPDLPWSAFRTYHPNAPRVLPDRTVLYEPNARVRNAFGVMKKTELACVYDLEAKQILFLFENGE